MCSSLSRPKLLTSFESSNMIKFPILCSKSQSSSLEYFFLETITTTLGIGESLMRFISRDVKCKLPIPLAFFGSFQIHGRPMVMTSFRAVGIGLCQDWILDTVVVSSKMTWELHGWLQVRSCS